MTLGYYVNFLCRLAGLRWLLQDGAELAEHMARGSCLRKPLVFKPREEHAANTLHFSPPLALRVEEPA